MFQYAAARAFALVRELPLRLHIAGFDDYGLHQGFELQRVFNCNVQLASVVELRSVLGWRASTKIIRILARPEFTILRGASFVVEPHFHYWSGLRNAPMMAYLHGYWQSEKYFADVATAIREDFSFHHPLSAANVVIANMIDAAGSAVSLHVRRGDYISDARTHAVHGLCSIDYYRSAVRYITDRVMDPVFFVFSDDIAWAKSNFAFDYPCHYIDHNRGAESYNDMRLMSLCRNHIIANSSFSWWGAWLNSSDDKIVVAPKRWFASNDKSTKDLLPAEWVTI